MDFENKYPYTDFHELNLDWILKQMKALAAAWDAYQEQLTGTNGEWPTFKNYIETAWATYQINLTGPNGEWPTFKATMEQAWADYQESLTGTNGEWPTFKATMEGEWQQFFDTYLQTLGVVQTTGSSITDVMSQKAVTDELKKYVHDFGTVVSNSNYASLGIHSLADFELNASTTIDGTITSSLISDLPFYGYAMNVIKIGSPTYHIALYTSISNGTDAARKIWFTSYNGVNYGVWKQLVNTSDIEATYHHETGTIVSHANHASLGINDVLDFEPNKNYTIGVSVTESDIARLPIYNDTGVISRFQGSPTADDGYGWFLYKSLYYNNRAFIASIHDTVWLDWIEITNTQKKAKTGTYEFFTVPINQIDPFTDVITDSVVDSETLSNVNCVLWLPDNYKTSGDKVPLIMFCHGAGQYVASSTCDGIDTLDYFHNNGYAIFDVNGSTNYNAETIAKGMNMGSPRAVQAYYKAYQYIVKNYNVDDKIFVTAKSMGGLAALNFCYRFSNIVRAVGLCYPVTNLKDQAWDHPWLSTVREKIASEYWFSDTSGNTYEDDKVVGFNPYKNNSSTTENFFNLPIKIWHGNADAVVDYTGSVNYVNKIRNAGGYAWLRIMNGHGHSMGSGANIYNVECYLWFRRFLEY